MLHTDSPADHAPSAAVSPPAPTPFIAAPVARRSFVERLRETARPDLATQAVQNLLAERHPAELSTRMLFACLAEYGLDERTAHGHLLALWRAALEAFLSDDVIADDEFAYLMALRRLFDIGEDDVMAIEAAVLHPRYQRAVADVLADNALTPEERRGLERLHAGLRLDPQVAERAFEQAAQAALGRVFQEIAADSSITAEEQARFTAAEQQLGVRADPAISFDAALYHLTWYVESGNLPIIAAPFDVLAGECCHFTVPARRLDFRATRGRRSGTPQEVDHGSFTITNKRLVFVGRRKSAAVRHQAVLRVHVTGNLVTCDRTTGAALRFVIPSRFARIVTGILANVGRQARGEVMTAYADGPAPRLPGGVMRASDEV